MLGAPPRTSLARAAAVGGVALTSLLTHSAQAAGCQYDPVHHFVYAFADPSPSITTIRVSAGPAPAAISVLVDGVPVACGAATTANTDDVFAYGPGGEIVFDASANSFAPGLEAEPGGLPEIELSASRFAQVTYLARSRATRRSPPGRARSASTQTTTPTSSTSTG